VPHSLQLVTLGAIYHDGCYLLDALTSVACPTGKCQGLLWPLSGHFTLTALPATLLTTADGFAAAQLIRNILSDILIGMAHTYGEVLPPSFPDIFSFARDPQQTVFIDAGSGYGALLAAAVTVYGCSHAIGIEKYKDKYLASLELVGQMPQALQQRVTIVLQDINDTDLVPLLDSLSFQTLLFFCNNVAFNSGTIHRYTLVYISRSSLRQAAYHQSRCKFLPVNWQAWSQSQITPG
jgi:hypothetical protein